MAVRYIDISISTTILVGKERLSETFYNKENVCNILINKNWEVFFYGCLNPTEAWSNMYNIIVDVTNMMCPLKTFHIKKRGTHG